MTNYTRCPPTVINGLIKSLGIKTNSESIEQKIIALYNRDAVKRSERKKRKLFFTLFPKEIRNVILTYLDPNDMCMVIEFEIFPNDPLTPELKKWAQDKILSYNLDFCEYLINKEGSKSWIFDLFTKWVISINFCKRMRDMYSIEINVSCYLWNVIDSPNQCNHEIYWKDMFAMKNEIFLAIIAHLISQKVGYLDDILKYSARFYPNKFLLLLQVGFPIGIEIIRKYITDDYKPKDIKEIQNMCNTLLQYFPATEQSGLLFETLSSVIWKLNKPEIKPYLKIIDQCLFLDQSNEIQNKIKSNRIIDLVMGFSDPEGGLEVLNKYSFNFSAQALNGKSFLQVAVSSQNLTLTKALIKYGADPSQNYKVINDIIFNYSTGDRTAIDYSIFAPEILKYFLETLPHRSTIATQQLSNICFLSGCYSTNTSLILSAQYCLDAGSSWLAVNSKKESFIIQTIRAQCDKLLVYLIKRYKEKNLLRVLEMPDQDGSTPIIVATVCHYTFGISLLLAHGVNINTKNNAGKTAPFIAAQQYKNVNYVLPFIACGANLALTDANGKKISDYLPELKVFE